MFALHPQQFATGGQQIDLPGFSKELLSDRGRCFDHVLAIIEDDEQLPRTDEIDELHARCVRFQHKSQGRPDGPHNLIRIGEASEVNEVDISAELFGNGVACGDSDGRLADAAGAKQGDERSARRLSMTSPSTGSRPTILRGRAGSEPWYRGAVSAAPSPTPATVPTNE